MLVVLAMELVHQVVVKLADIMTNPIDLQTAKSYIENLDLSYIVEAMCSLKYPLPRWVQQDAEHCCQLYKNFLYLQKKHHPTPLVPTREIDEFWHNHILYTKQYTHDCQQIFGFYLHHVPNSPSEGHSLINDFLHTKQFYLEEFGENIHDASSHKICT